MASRAEYNQRYYLKTRDKQVARARAWRAALTPEQKLELSRRNKRRDLARLERQREAAAGRPRPDRCENPYCRGVGAAKSKTKKTMWDHDHATGQFRGWLCGPCNSILGLAKDQAASLRWLANYVESGGIGPTVKMYTGILRHASLHDELRFSAH